MLFLPRSASQTSSAAVRHKTLHRSRQSYGLVFIAALTLIAVYAGAARADDTASSNQILTITLPAGGSNAAAGPSDSGAGPADNGAGIPSNSVSIPAPGQDNGQASSQNGAIAQLPPPDFNHLSVIAVGNVNEDGAQIVRRAGPSSMTVLFTCARGQSIGIVGQLGQWYCVEMADASLGCILVNRVNVTWESPGPVPDVPNNQQSPSDRLRPTPVLFPDSIRDNGSTPAGRRVVDAALRFLGVRYRWGGNTDHGIDCSGLVKAAFAREGIDLPRTAREQAEVGAPVSLSEIQPGDRLSFICHGSTVDHTGIYIGGGQFIEASGAKGEVAITPLESYLKYLVGIHRDFH
ncbi:MAG TPA: C40 family peptidase [Armatimonadota bacterium]|nr:C40 family peptidase [Armatimonadota bacterium]